MKSFFLTGTALAVVSVAFPAYAADDSGIHLNLGGYIKAYMSYIDQDEAAGQSVHPVDILRQTEVHFDGKTTLANGWETGVHVEGQADGDDSFFVDESYIFFAGEYGKFNLGRTYGAPYVLQVVAPAADSNIDGRLQLMQPVNFDAAGLTNVGETDYDQDISAKVDKVTYLTPLYSGFQAGFSFTPTVDNTSRALSGNAGDDPALSDVYDVAARFENKVGEDMSYRVGGGFTRAQSEGTTDDNREAWNAGLDLDVGAFGIGTAYQVDDLGDADDDAQMFVVGADYTKDSVVYGASYYNKTDDVNDVDFDRYSVGVTYKVIPGLSFRGSVGYYDINQATTDVQATSVLLGTDVKF